MRGALLMFVLGAACAAPATAAEPQWQEHIYRELGIAKEFPAPPRMERGSYQTEVSGRAVPATIYASELDGVMFRLTIAELGAPEFVAKSPSLYAECVETAEAEGKVLARMPQRVEDGTPYRVYGQMTSVELAGGAGRKLTNCFYSKGRLYRIEAHVTPAHGEFNSSVAIRFAASLRFRLDPPVQ